MNIREQLQEKVDNSENNPEDLENKLGAKIVEEVACPYADCPAGKGAKCRTKSHYNENMDLVKGGNVKDSIHQARYNKAKKEGVL